MSSSIALEKPRLITLTLNWCFAVISASVGLNALIKSNQDKSRLEKLAPSPTKVYINTADISNVGINTTVASLIIAILVSQFVLAPYIPFTKAIAAKTVKLQAIVLTVFNLWLVGTLIPFDIFFATHEASVKAFIGTVQLPDATVRAVEAASGSTRLYRKIYYLKLVASLPWITFFFTIASIVVLFAASKRQTVAAAPAAAEQLTSEKETSSHHETIEKSSV